MDATGKSVMGRLTGKPICPYCGKEIEDLKVTIYTTRMSRLHSNGGYDEWEYGGDGETCFDCPECEETICHDHDIGLEFLTTGVLKTKP